MSFFLNRRALHMILELRAAGAELREAYINDAAMLCSLDYRKRALANTRVDRARERYDHALANCILGKL